MHSKHVPLSLPNTRSTRNENTSEEEEEKLHYTTLNYKMEMKLLLKLCIYPTLEPQGGTYRHQGNRGPGDKPWPEAARAPRPMAARAALRAARGPICPLSASVPGFGFAAPCFDKISLLDQWLS